MAGATITKEQWETLLTDIAVIKPAIERLDKTVNGNGNPGLASRMASIEFVVAQDKRDLADAVAIRKIVTDKQEELLERLTTAIEEIKTKIQNIYQDGCKKGLELHRDPNAKDRSTDVPDKKQNWFQWLTERLWLPLVTGIIGGSVTAMILKALTIK